MSNLNIETRLDLIIKLLETLPKRMVNEIEYREVLQDKLRQHDLKTQYQARLDNLKEINDVRSGSYNITEEIK